MSESLTPVNRSPGVQSLEGGSQGIGHDLPLAPSSSQPGLGASAIPSTELKHIAQEEEELARLTFQWEAKKLELDAKRLQLESQRELARAAKAEKDRKELEATTHTATIPVENKRESGVEPRKGLRVPEKQNLEGHAPISREDQSHFCHVFRLELSKTRPTSTRTTPGATTKSDDGTTIWERVAGKNVCLRCKWRGEGCYRYTKSTGQYSACQSCVEAKAKCSTCDMDDSSGARLANLSTAARKRSFLYAGNHPEDADEAHRKRARRETTRIAQRTLSTPPTLQAITAGLAGQNRDDEILEGVDKLLNEQLYTRKVLEDIRDMLESGRLIHQQMLPIDYPFRQAGPSLSAEIDDKEFME